jgi:ubiquinone/menaquinone biosynthesis C-methylase UbiE
MSWWDQNLPALMPDFVQWTGNPRSATKTYLREHLAAIGYRTMLDAAAGLCVQWDALRDEGSPIEYQAIDSCRQLVEQAAARGVPVIHGDIEDLPWPAAHFDAVVAQHVLEHLASYEKAMTELARVARRELVIVFFLVPHQQQGTIAQFDGLLYNNIYSRPEIEAHVAQVPRFAGLRWVSVERRPSNGIPCDAVLHVTLTLP